MTRTELIRLSREHRISPSKRLGQHFLCDGRIAARIVEAADVAAADRVLEVGPGFGALTEKLVERAGHVTAVEIDAGLARYLKERFDKADNLTLVHADFLGIEPETGFTKTVSNLPYCASSEIIFALSFRFLIPRAYVMLQREMARRIVAPPGGKEYGALSVAIGLDYEARILFTIGKTAFYPRPEVDSSFVLLRRKARAELEGAETELFQRIVKSAFWGRRKTLAAALSRSPHLDFEKSIVVSILGETGISGKARGEDLSVNDFIRLARTARKYSA
jgi:16S rRNA (adenine1518-N6/adenine1519-N6)-dimethyltransferase